VGLNLNIGASVLSEELRKEQKHIIVKPIYSSLRSGFDKTKINKYKFRFFFLTGYKMK